MNVRWDDVVDRSLWDGGVTRPTARRGNGCGSAGAIAVTVRLFGALASPGAKRSFELALPGGATLNDVIGAVARERGEEFLARVLDPAGGKQRFCRLFVDGVAVEELDTPLATADTPTQVEIILLMGFEGG